MQDVLAMLPYFVFVRIRIVVVLRSETVKTVIGRLKTTKKTPLPSVDMASIVEKVFVV